MSVDNYSREIAMASIRLTRYEAQEGQLPPVCMVCGQRAELFTSKTMYWHPPWVFVLLLLGLLPFIIAALLTQQRLRLKAPLCSNHLNHWQARSLAIWLSLLGFIVVGIGAFVILLQMQPPGRRAEDTITGFVCIGGLVLLVIWLVLVAVLQSTAVRPKEIGDRYIILTGVAPRFIDALDDPQYFPDREEDDYPEDRPPERRRPPPLPAESDYYEEDKPRRRSPPPDAFEDRD